MVSNRDSVLEPKEWMSFHIERRFWNLSDWMMSLTILGGEAVSGAAPQRGQSKLSIHVHLRLFQKAFPRVVELANKRKIELGLPFLDESQLHGSKVTSSSEQRDWAPNEQVVVILPIS